MKARIELKWPNFLGQHILIKNVVFGQLIYSIPIYSFMALYQIEIIQSKL